MCIRDRLCALTAALIFLPFYLLDGGFFHYAGDFNIQQISFYRYMNGFLKGAGYPAGYEGVKLSLIHISPFPLTPSTPCMSGSMR